MIRNGKDIATGTVLTTQVCIIGSGPAGITAAWYLQKAGINVIVIEGSRPVSNYKQSWNDKVMLYNGEASGLFASNEPDFLIRPNWSNSSFPTERERVFGGTSTHWGGQSRPLDPIDFEKRPNFPGWPISRADLDPYYAQAVDFCKLHANRFDAEYWAEILKADVPLLDGFDTDMYQFIGPDYLDFSTRKFDGMTIGESDADIILNASLLNIIHQNGCVNELLVASMNNDSTPQQATQFTIQADAYVLACGSVANARQLLLSNVGNEYDLVGRYFMCHPLSSSTVINITNNYLTYDQTRLMGGDGADGNRWTDDNGVTVNARFIPSAEQATALGIGRCWFWASWGQYYFEMTPNPLSRVTLSDSLDPVFNQPQTNINWQLSPADQNTYEQSTALFKTAVNKLGGDVSFYPWEDVQNQLVVNGHHLGTTRMSANPEDGVVDANLKVHSVDNLYVAGASVFPNAGISNPTFTIITLSIRLAEHLSGVLR
jgi:choline dehydrogenase-like flavoprotein